MPLFWDDWSRHLQTHFPFLSFMAGGNAPIYRQYFVEYPTTFYKFDTEGIRERNRQIAHVRVRRKESVPNDELLLQSAIENIASDRSLAGVLFITTYQDLQILMDSAPEGRELNIWDVCTFPTEFQRFPRFMILTLRGLYHTLEWTSHSWSLKNISKMFSCEHVL